MSFSNLSQMSFVISDKQKTFLKEVDDICRSIRQYEEKCYLEEKLNDKIIPEFGKIGMLGCPISRSYGGLGYDILTYILAIERGQFFANILFSTYLNRSNGSSGLGR
ncbi:MAG: acyl-CoA dehydrogenase family protein [Candidatus Nitrosopolaris sp.]